MDNTLNYHKNKTVLGIFLITSLLFFTSCIEVKETLTLHKSGGGNYSFVIYYNQYLNEVKDKKVLATTMDELYEELASLQDDLMDMEGITNAQKITDDMGAFGFSFDFVDDHSLFNALNYTSDILVEVDEKSITHSGIYPAIIQEMENITPTDLEGLVDEKLFKEYKNAVYTFTVNSYKPMQLRPSGLPEAFSDEGKTVTYTYLYNSGTFKPEDYNHTIYFQ